MSTQTQVPGLGGPVVASIGQIKQQLAVLETRARAGDVPALMALRDVAKAATEALHGVWFNEAATLPAPLFDSFAQRPGSPFPAPFKAPPALPLAERRHIMNFWLGGDALATWGFPLLHWPEEKRDDKRQRELLRGLGETPGATGRVQESIVRDIWLCRVLPHFQEVREHEAGAGTLTERIRRLPPLSGDTVPAWVEVVSDWFKANPALLSHKKLRALGEHERQRQIRAKRRRLKIAYNKSEADPAIRETRRLVREQKAASTPLTDSMILTELRAQLTRWLGSQFPAPTGKRR